LQRGLQFSRVASRRPVRKDRARRIAFASDIIHKSKVRSRACLQPCNFFTGIRATRSQLIERSAGAPGANGARQRGRSRRRRVTRGTSQLLTPAQCAPARVSTSVREHDRRPIAIAEGGPSRRWRRPGAVGDALSRWRDKERQSDGDLQAATPRCAPATHSPWRPRSGPRRRKGVGSRRYRRVRKIRRDM
jgi:hypothetical protein